MKGWKMSDDSGRILQPKDVILVFECEDCDNIEKEMASVAVYNGPPLCEKCKNIMDFSHGEVPID
jgi:hypothetical protein